MDSERLPSGRSVRRALRLLFVVLLAVTLLSAGHSALTYDPIGNAAPPAESGLVNAEPAVVATIDGVGPGQIVAYDADGNVVYRNRSLFLYHDVDPSPAGEHTVTYVASDVVDGDACAGESCLRNIIERVNLTTGEVTRLHSWVDPRNGSAQTHDVDRINESTFLVADISFPDRVYMVNTTTGEVTWEWRVSEAYDPESGGSYPGDWTHINDVEHLPDGRVMANLRNQDQVVFIEPGEGIQANWTLGADDDHGTLYEPHNPDYIPESRGGPAVVIADSENNRLVEYQRRNGSWVRTWHWQDTTMQWPRDADRLPSGRTLVADSHGQRIMSLEPDGSVAWSRSFPPGSYDVEMLGTGDESAGGTSAAELDLRSRWPGSPVRDGDTSMRGAAVGPGETDPSDGSGSEGPDGVDGSGESAETGAGVGLSPSFIVYRLVSFVPPLVLHGLLYSLPPWASAVDVVLLIATVVVGAGTLTLEVGTRLARRIRTGRE